MNTFLKSQTKISMNFKIFKTFFQNALYPYSKIYTNVFITQQINSKLLTMYNFDYSNHKDLNYYVSEYVNVKMKTARNLKNTYFRTKMLYTYIADHLHTSLIL